MASHGMTLRALLAPILLGSLALAASPAQAQQTAYDVTLRSIAPATINPAALDGRPRQTVLSIAPASLENQPGIVPAVFDPAVGRFISAIGNTRGAIAVSSSGAVSVIVNNQSSTMQLGGGSTGVPLRSEAVASPSSTVTAQQITTTPAAAAR